jgi:hypothetical protein
MLLHKNYKKRRSYDDAEYPVMPLKNKGKI